jgi:hypothetical protein
VLNRSELDEGRCQTTLLWNLRMSELTGVLEVACQEGMGKKARNRSWVAKYRGAGGCAQMHVRFFRPAKAELFDTTARFR